LFVNPHNRIQEVSSVSYHISILSWIQRPSDLEAYSQALLTRRATHNPNYPRKTDTREGPYSIEYRSCYYGRALSGNRNKMPRDEAPQPPKSFTESLAPTLFYHGEMTQNESQQHCIDTNDREGKASEGASNTEPQVKIGSGGKSQRGRGPKK
jgi:hypothetical protein